MTTSPTLRPIGPADVDDVLALNQRNVDLLAPMDEARLAELAGWAERADVIDLAGVFAGFVLTFAPGTPYDSANYRWFSHHFGDAFTYLDRIVLHEDVRRRGLGTAVYDLLEEQAAASTRMALEVNVEPPNPASLAFHAARGYVEVGRRVDGGKAVSLLAKDLTPAGARSGDSPR